MNKMEKCSCKAHATTVFQRSIWKFVTFSSPWQSWLLSCLIFKNCKWEKKGKCKRRYQMNVWQALPSYFNVFLHCPLYFTFSHLLLIPLIFVLAGMGIFMGRQKSRRTASPGGLNKKGNIPVCHPIFSWQLATRWQRYLHPERTSVVSKVGFKPLRGQHCFSSTSCSWPRL